MPSRARDPGAAPANKPRPLEVVAAEYEEHFQRKFGARWPELRSALLSPLVYASLTNKYCSQNAAPAEDIRTEALPLKLSCCRRVDRDQSFPPPQADAAGLLANYLIDAASLVAVEALDVSPGDIVLDMCAAPGGKAVAILQQLDLVRGGQLQCNDASADRCARLRRALGQYVPREQSSAIKITQHDGTVQTSFARLFNKVLVDAPCSTDRHLLQNVQELQRWTPATPARNAERQFKLLCSALQAARSPALVVYTTTALDDRENDGVVRAVLQRFPERVRVRPVAQLAFGEPTALGGWLVLPDRADGWGPLYFAALEVAEAGLMAARTAGADDRQSSQNSSSESDAGSSDEDDVACRPGVA